MSIQIALPLFEGPLDLLLYLIKENKINIYDIPISLITKQYLEYLELMKELDLEVASEFLIMAANLIYIKSRMLLPKPEKIEEDEDPRQDLVNQLVEHMKFKEVSKILNEQYQIWSKAFPRKISNEEEVYIEEISVFDLFTAIKRIIHKKENKIHIPREPIRVEDKIEEIIKLLQERKTLIFEELFKEPFRNRDVTKLEIIVTFLAILELLRLKVIKAFQKKPFGKIFINLEESNDNRCDF
ncbi:MAG: segregation/condensation protein A [Thermodesulfovibrio sp.]|nr:segregation/condensation protein A [Thermodesulfovibrio sp.]